MPEPKDAFPYLCVDEFLKTMIDAKALATAFEMRLIDYLQEHTSSTFDAVQRCLCDDRQGLQFLLGSLASNNVVVWERDTLRLSDRFLHALRYRDLLEAKLDFAQLVAPDLLNFFHLLIQDPGEFMSRARLFELFGYHRCFDRTDENYELTRQWMRFTTALTKYEAEACLQQHDFSKYKKLLDIGGNSGEFVLRICKRHAAISGTIVDLPLVCDVGTQHVFAEPEAERISFHPADVRSDRLPTGFDIVTFKSMLHDWPDAEVSQFIEKAASCLVPGGTLLIFERSSIEFGPRTIPYGSLPMLLFFRSFRSPKAYEKILEASGFVEINTVRVDLETPFLLTSGRKA